MAEQGVFADVDAAMILHPADESYESGDSLAMDAIQFDFRGKTVMRLLHQMRELMPLML